MTTSARSGPPEAGLALIDEVSSRLGPGSRVAQIFENCYLNAWRTTLQRRPDGTTFVITGDIPAMWLRDSSAQLRPYLHLAANDTEVADVLAGAVRQQMRYAAIDPYANAFNAAPNDAHWHAADRTDDSGLAARAWVWERKYELDSLCYPLQFAHDLWRVTGRTDHLDGEFATAAGLILELWRREQDHDGSGYRFERDDGAPSDTLGRAGRGSAVAVTGMTWSGFRPSDDACRFGYLVPANMFAAVVLDGLAAMAEQVLRRPAMAEHARTLALEIREGLRRHASVEHPEFGRIWAYETDGLGHHELMDDANVPSLLSLPYLGWCEADDPLYLATRAFVLSEQNPQYRRGAAAAGIGSPHTPPGHIWPMALAIQGLTSVDRDEQERLLDTLARTDAGTRLMHESFHADDPATYTRPWFSWANSLFSELVLRFCGLERDCAPGSA